MATTVTETVAKGLQRYVSPIKDKLVKKPIKRQMMEINGLIEFNKGSYHNEHYEKHIQTVVETRKAFRDTKDITQRKKIATEELGSWRKYVETRRGELSEDYAITEKMKNNLEQAWDLVKNRHEKTLNPSKVLKLHEEFAKFFKFDIPIDPKNLARLIHPHYGYLSTYPGPLHFEDVIDIYSNKIVSGYEDYCGQEILASEIAAYTYWVSIDKECKGYMSIKDFSEFMKIFRMAVPDNEKGLTNEFKFALSYMPEEFTRDISESESIVRFDLMRYIFLERNL